MSEPVEPTTAAVARPVRPAANYTWRLLMLIPALALVAYGYWRYTDVSPGGDVTSIRLTSKENISGQVRDAYAGVLPTTADFFLILARRGAEPLRLETFEDTPLGNGLTWQLPAAMAMSDLVRVEVWDDNGLLSDKELDRIELPGDLAKAWEIDGQTFHVRLNGRRLDPPRWATPLMAVGGVLFAVVLLRFVWDQAI